MFEHDYFFLPYLKGDKSANIYGRYILAERIKLLDLKTNDLYINARKYLNPDYYEELLKNNTSEMSESDISKVNTEKKALENIVLYRNKFGENCQKMKDKISLYKKPEAYREISKLTLNSILEQLDKIDTIHENIKEKLNPEIDKMNIAINAATNFDINDFFTFNYKKSYEISLESLSTIDEVFLPLANNITSTIKKAEKADSLSTELIVVYKLPRTSNATYNSMAEKLSVLTSNQKVLIKEYDDIILSLKQELEISKNITTTNLLLDNLNSINERVINLKDTDLKELVKLIKKSKTIQDKMSLIQNQQ